MEEQEYLELINFYAKDILKSDNMQGEQSLYQHGVVSVYDHSMAVAIECLKLAKRFNIDIDKRALIRGALLHDYFLYDWHIPGSHNKWHAFTHAKIALENADKEYNLSPVEKNMIASHMFPLNLRIPKYKESIILTIADKICATKELIDSTLVRERKSQQLR